MKARLAIQLLPHRLDLPREALSAAQAGVRNPARLVHDMLRVGYGPGRISAHEYFYYRLYDASIPDEERVRFLGKRRLARIYEDCNHLHWFAAMEDKLLCDMAVSAAGLPIPRTQAIYTQSVRRFGTPVIREPQALADFLRQPSHYPLFVKPIDGMGSVGALSLAGVNGDWIDFTTGELARIGDVVRFIHEFGGHGFLLQDRLDPHAELRQRFGPIIPTVRFLVLLSPEAVQVESAVLKIASARNPADNYWRSGNMLASLDENGSIARVVTGVGAGLRELTANPETGAPLMGLTLPFWAEASQACCQAASIFPRVRIQSWDVALTDAGPVLVEGNYGGAINLHQLAHQRGTLTPVFMEHLRRCGCTVIN